ncbi:MAG: heme exporter protein CcmB [Sphingomicrobium sp.]
MIGALILRDARRGFTGGAWLPIAFFLLIAMLVPFAIGPDAQLLNRIGPGAMWIAALTAALLPIERLIEPDRADGTLDQLALHGMAEEVIAVAKIAAHWLTFAPPLMLAALPAASLLGLDRAAFAGALVSLWIGMPGLAALAVAVAALTAGLPRAGALAGLLLLPLAVPLLIFGASVSGGGGGNSALLLEAAVSIPLLAGAPFVTAAAIRAART